MLLRELETLVNRVRDRAITAIISSPSHITRGVQLILATVCTYALRAIKRLTHDSAPHSDPAHTNPSHGEPLDTPILPRGVWGGGSAI